MDTPSPEQSAPDEDLARARARIDAADRALFLALRERLSAVRDIGAVKHDQGSALRDPARESEVAERWARLAREQGLDPLAAGRVLREVLGWSRREQEQVWRAPAAREVRVAFQGTTGAHGELAARRLIALRGARARTLGQPSFDAAVEALLRGEVDYALLPVENTLVGGIEAVSALLMQGRVHIVDEEIWQVRNALVGLPGSTLEGLRRVSSHPVALRQCRRTLVESMGLEALEVWDTAGAADAVVMEGDPSHAAVCSAEAARARELVLLREDVSDHPDNRTRFALLAREAEPVPPGVPARTTLRLVADHQAGALARCLGAFAAEGVNLTRLASLVLPRRSGQYGFLIDLEGHVDDPPVARALGAVRRAARQVSLLGCYPDRSRETDGPLLPAALQAAPAPAPAACAKVAPRSDLPLVSAEARDAAPRLLAGVPIGGERFVLIAGPCAVESKEQIEEAADMVQASGAALLRGGGFKPRTSTYSFQGLGLAGVELLAEAGRRRGLPIVTEVLRAADVEAVAERADVLQIGARNMQNFELLRALGTIDRPVLLKRGMSATIEEWLHAAEYVLAGGNQQVVLCERGIRTFETATRATLDVAAIPVLKRRTHLPVIVDPSHAAGVRELVVPLALAAAAAGADGLIVECHPDPSKARCDGPQALTRDDLAALVRGLEPILRGQGRRLA